MNFLTKFFLSAKDTLKEFDPLIQLEMTGGCFVQNGVRYTPLTLLLPAIRSFDLTYDCTSDPVAACDFLRERWDDSGLMPLDKILVQVQSLPNPKKILTTNYSEWPHKPEKKVREKDHWRVQMLLPCPPALHPKDEKVRQELSYLARKVSLDVPSYRIEPKFEVGEILKCGGSILSYLWAETVRYSRGRSVFYLGTVDNEKGTPAHCVLRVGTRRTQWRSKVGRTLYAVKFCLLEEEIDLAKYYFHPDLGGLT